MLIGGQGVKKYLVVIFLLLLTYIPLSAQFVLSPKTAYLNANLDSFHGHYFDVSFDAMYAFKNGFTIMSVHDFPIVGNGNDKYEKYPILGANFISSLLFGYTYRGIKNLYITTTAGLSTTLGIISYGYFIPLGISLQFDVQYYFNTNFGISVALKEDAIFLPHIKTYGADFLNVNILKIGAAFRFN